MNWLALITALGPLVTSLVQAVGGIIGDVENKQAVNSATVKQALQAIIEGIEAASSGGQKNTWQEIANVAALLVDEVAGIVNVVNPGTVTAAAAGSGPAKAAAGPAAGLSS